MRKFNTFILGKECVAITDGYGNHPDIKDARSATEECKYFEKKK